ncbi:MAG TPA: chorismate synthase [Kiritimatiellae bacterium]|nr:chorismate synthase [Kiritimatiellia bacterium]
MSSILGRIFRITTFGESHGPAVGAVVEGCPPGIRLVPSDIQAQLDRRRPGQSEANTPRSEEDRVRILSGVEGDITLGTPIALLVWNKDQNPSDYEDVRKIPRPSHADYAYRVKYGVQAQSGGGRASGRETVGRVAGGAVAEKMLRERYGVEIVAWVSRVGSVAAPEPDRSRISRVEVDATAVRCPDREAAAAMLELIREVKREGDSIGGIVSCVCRGAPAGWGEPVFGKVEALLAQAMLSIPAARGFDIGSGFGAALMRGLQHNDPFVRKGQRLGTLSNFSGGVQGGITNGEDIYFRVAFKPPASIRLPQKTADYEGRERELILKGRHDPCIVPRAVPVVEAMAALVLADLAMLQESRQRSSAS